MRSPLRRISTDPYTFATHAKWDADVLARGLQPSPNLLCLIIDQCKTLNQKYKNLEDATALYEEHFALRDELRTACESGTFRSVRNLAILQRPGKYVPPDESRRELDGALDDFKESMLRYASGKADIEEWAPLTEASAHLHIPCRSPEGFPDLLLHDLGKWSEPGGVMHETIPKVFSTRGNTFIFNASGTGKTRFVFEGLSKHWGFYFTCATDFQSHHGSKDVSNAINEIRLTDGFSHEIPEATSDYSLIVKNRDIAEQCFLAVWLARLIVFELFLESAPSTSTDTTLERQRRWLFLQIFPRHLLKKADIFSSIVECFTNADIGFMRMLIQETFMNIGKLLPPGGHLFAVFDEAQHAAHDLTGAFLSNEYDRHTPVLGELIATWERFGHGVTLIVSGTRSFTHVHRDSNLSVTGAPKEWSVFTSIGAFDGRKVHEQYIMRYIWPGVKDRTELSHGEQAILNGAWQWLRGRHRYTATFVSFLLFWGLESAHKFLNVYFNRFTQFTLTDDPDLAEQGADLSWKENFRLNGLSATAIGDTADPQFKNDVFQAFLRSHCKGETAITSAEEDSFVDFGVAHFCETPGSSKKDTRLDEPIILASMSVAFASESDCSVNMRPPTKPLDLCSPELLAFYFRSVFNGSTPLATVIKFIPTDPQWASKPAELIAIVGESSNGVHKTCRVTPREGPSPLIGQQSTTSKDTLRWLENPDGAPFCFPDSAFGPDILFLIRIDKRFVWVVVQTKFDDRQVAGNASSESNPDDNATNEASSSPSVRTNLIPTALSRYRLTPTGRRSRSKQTVRKDATSFLRLVASYPSHPDEKSLKEAAAEYPSAFGLVNMEYLIKVMKPILPWLKNSDEDQKSPKSE